MGLMLMLLWQLVFSLISFLSLSVFIRGARGAMTSIALADAVAASSQWLSVPLPVWMSGPLLSAVVAAPWQQPPCTANLGGSSIRYKMDTARNIIVVHVLV